MARVLSSIVAPRHIRSNDFSNTKPSIPLVSDRPFGPLSILFTASQDIGLSVNCKIPYANSASKYSIYIMKS
jgi:hypothetical protein